MKIRSDEQLSLKQSALSGLTGESYDIKRTRMPNHISVLNTCGHRERSSLISFLRDVEKEESCSARDLYSFEMLILLFSNLGIKSYYHGNMNYDI